MQLKSLDPEQLRSIDSGRPYVMSVNRDLRLPTITEPAAFLDEVEQASKRFDVASPAPGEGSETLRVREGQPVLVA